ncbi:unnamed protein product [Camellia sinensis]
MTTSIASFSSIPISPLSFTRSKRTTEIIWSARKEEIITDSDLREIDLYSFQGHLKQKGKAKFGATFQQWQTDAANFNIDGHYPVRELWDRARSCWTKILTHESMFVLVVAHNAVNQALVAIAIGLGTEYFRILLQSNCGVSVLDFTPRLEVNEYKRGISGWNFNLEDVKAQASLDEDIISEKDLGGSSVSSSGLHHEKELQHQLSSEDNDLMQNQPSSLSADVTLTNVTKYEKSDDDASIAGSNQEHQVSQNSASCFEDNVKIIFLENLAQMSVKETLTARLCKVIRGGEVHQAISFFQMVVFSQAKERVDKSQNQLRDMSSCNGAPVPQALDDAPPEILSRASRTSVNSEELDDKVKPLVQQKGRFKVTSENVDLEKVHFAFCTPWPCILLFRRITFTISCQVGPNPLMQKSHSIQPG